MSVTRYLRRWPSGFWVVASVLALAVGATASIGAVVDALVLNPIPVPRPEKLLSLGGLAWGDGLGDPVDYWSQANGLESLATYRAGDVRDTDGMVERWTRIAEISGRFFRVFLINPVRGRLLQREDETESLDVAVVSHAYWRGRLSGRQDVLGCLIRLEGRAYTIVGVAPRGFDFPPGTQVWIPQARVQSVRPHLVEGASELGVIRRATGFVGRLRPGASLQQVQSQLEGLLAYANQVISLKSGIRYGEIISVTRLVDSMSRTFRSTLSVLMAGAAVVLVVATANCALFFFSVSTRRRTELAVRQLLGASPNRVGRQLLGEALVVGMVSGVLGFLVSRILLGVAGRSLRALGVELSTTLSSSQRRIAMKAEREVE